MDYWDYFVTYRQVVLGLLDMHISQKPKDVLHTTDVPSKNLTFLSHNRGQRKEKNTHKVSKQACINDVSISQNLQN